MVVQVEAHRCAHCGARVSAFPAQALVLQETRLTVLDSCTDCGICVCCPKGALAASDRDRVYVRPIQDSNDVAVVGAGPAGPGAAREAAERGVSTLLPDTGQEIGAPVRCAEGVTSGAQGLNRRGARWGGAPLGTRWVTLSPRRIGSGLCPGATDL